MTEQNSNLMPHVLVRSKNGVELFPVPNPMSNRTQDIVAKGGTTLISGESCTFHAFSSDGTKVLMLRPSVGLVLVNNLQHPADISPESLNKSILEEDSKLVHIAYFSPLGNFIVTWERPIKTKDGSNPPNNLKVWDANTGKLLHGLFAKAMPQKLPSQNPSGIGGEQYSTLQFTHDETLLCHVVSNEIQVYDTQDIIRQSAPIRSTFKLRCANISSFTLAPKNITSTSAFQYLVSTFVPEVKGKPARVALHELTFQRTDKVTITETILTSKSFYQTEDVTVKWSPHGNAALVLTQTTVDATGESYYGSSSLHLLLSHPKPSNIHVELPGKGSGPVHDVAWCPSPNPSSSTAPPTFALISGKMPAMGSLHYGTTGDASFIFGEAHRNVVSWSPHGRFLCLAGFGNLAGGMDFWDRNKLKKIPRFHPGNPQPIDGAEIRAHCAVGYGWSPDSRTFFVSTTNPRMNVDNSIKLFKYNGYGPFDQTLKTVAWNNESYLPNKLHSVEFIPTPADTYPDRPQSPPPKKTTENATLLSASTASSTNTIAAPVPTVGRYIPPSARARSGMGGGNSLAERMRREREGNTAQAGKVTRPMSAAFGSTKKVIPGMAPATDSATKSKNAQRREKQRLAKQKLKEEEEAKAKLIAEESAKAKEAAAAATVDPEKRAKKIKKLLKQIDDLKTKDKSELNEDQLKKLSSEDELRKELESLAL